MTSTTDWREMYRSLKEKIKFIFSSALFSNVTLTVSNGVKTKMFRGHSVFLTMASPVFERMLESDFEESSYQIKIDEIDPDVFQSFLQFVYFDSVDLKSFYEACQLYKIGHKYLVVPLQEFCVSYIRQNLNVATATAAFEIGDVYDLEDIKRAARQIMVANTTEVVTHEEFVRAKDTTILALLDEPNLNITEYELFKSIEHWINNHKEKTTSDAILCKFHYFDMTLKEFAEGPCKSGLLSSEQKLAIFENMSTENGPPLPDGFTKKRRKKNPDNYQSLCLDLNISRTVDFIKHRYIYFMTDKTVTLKAVEFSTRECSETYEEEFGVKIWEVRKDCESITEVKRRVKGGMSEIVELSWPTTVIAGRKYTLVVWTKGGDYKASSLDEIRLEESGVAFHFMPDPSSPPILPLLSIYFTK